MKDHYANDVFVFDKPILVIANKYNSEWDQPPINYLDIPALDRLINLLANDYQIVYNRPLPASISGDNSVTYDLGEHQWIKFTHPGVVFMDELYNKHRHEFNSFNTVQLMVYANCDRFISMHGGTAALASYFGGTNIILSKRGIEHELKEFETIFPKLSGANILHASSNDELFRFIRNNYVKGATEVVV